MAAQELSSAAAATEELSSAALGVGCPAERAGVTARDETEAAAIDREVGEFLASLKRDGDARRFERFAIALPVEVTAGGATHSGMTIDISEGGVGLRLPEGVAIPPGTAVTPRIGAARRVVAGRVVHDGADLVGIEQIPIRWTHLIG